MSNCITWSEIVKMVEEAGVKPDSKIAVLQGHFDLGPNREYECHVYPANERGPLGATAKTVYFSEKRRTA